MSLRIHIQDETQPATPRQRKVLAVVACVLLLVSPLWFLGAGYFYRQAREVQETWTPAEARVIELCEDRDSDSSVFYPRFRFTAADGQTYEVKGNLGTSDPEYGVGDMMPILYPGENPARAVENSFMAHHLPTIVLGVFGAADFLFGCLLFYASRRRNLRVSGGDGERSGVN